MNIKSEHTARVRSSTSWSKKFHIMAKRKSNVQRCASCWRVGATWKIFTVDVLGKEVLPHGQRSSTSWPRRRTMPNDAHPDEVRATWKIFTVDALGKEVLPHGQRSSTSWPRGRAMSNDAHPDEVRATWKIFTVDVLGKEVLPHGQRSSTSWPRGISKSYDDGCNTYHDDAADQTQRLSAF